MNPNQPTNPNQFGNQQFPNMNNMAMQNGGGAPQVGNPGQITDQSQDIRYLPDSLSYMEFAPYAFPHKFKQLKIPPFGASGQFAFESGNKLQYYFRGNDFLDPWSVYLEFTIIPNAIEDGGLEDEGADYFTKDGLYYNYHDLSIKNKVIQLDGCAHSFFDQMTVLDQGNKLEEILHYDVIGNILKDVNYSWYDGYTKYSEGVGSNHLGFGQGTDLTSFAPSSLSRSRPSRYHGHSHKKFDPHIGLDAEINMNEYNYWAPYKRYPKYPHWSVDVNAIEELQKIDPTSTPSQSYKDMIQAAYNTALLINNTSSKSVLGGVGTFTHKPPTGATQTISYTNNQQLMACQNQYDELKSVKNGTVISVENTLLQRGDANKNKKAFWHPFRDNSFTIADSLLKINETANRKINQLDNAPIITPLTTSITTQIPITNTVPTNSTNSVYQATNNSFNLGDNGRIAPDWLFCGPILTNQCTRNIVNANSWLAPQTFGPFADANQNMSEDILADLSTLYISYNYLNRSHLTPDDFDWHSSRKFATGIRDINYNSYIDQSFAFTTTGTPVVTTNITSAIPTIKHHRVFNIRTSNFKCGEGIGSTFFGNMDLGWSNRQLNSFSPDFTQTSTKWKVSFKDIGLTPQIINYNPDFDNTPFQSPQFQPLRLPIYDLNGQLISSRYRQENVPTPLYNYPLGGTRVFEDNADDTGSQMIGTDQQRFLLNQLIYPRDQIPPSNLIGNTFQFQSSATPTIYGKSATPWINSFLSYTLSGNANQTTITTGTGTSKDTDTIPYDYYFPEFIFQGFDSYDKADVEYLKPWNFNLSVSNSTTVITDGVVTSINVTANNPPPFNSLGIVQAQQNPATGLNQRSNALFLSSALLAAINTNITPSLILNNAYYDVAQNSSTFPAQNGANVLNYNNIVANPMIPDINFSNAWQQIIPSICEDDYEANTLKKGTDYNSAFYGSQNPFPGAFSVGCFEPMWSKQVLQRYMENGKPTVGPIQAKTFYIPVLSGILGSLMPAQCYKLLPLRAFKELMLQYQLAEHALFTSWHNTDQKYRKFKMVNCNLFMEVAQFYDDAIYRALDESLAVGISIQTTSWFMSCDQEFRQGTLPSEYILTTGYDSLKSLIFAFYSQDYLRSSAMRKHYRWSCNLKSFQIKNGNDYYPNDKLAGHAGTNDGRLTNAIFLHNLKKIFGKHNTSDQSLINAGNFAVNFREFDCNIAQYEANYWSDTKIYDRLVAAGQDILHYCRDAGKFVNRIFDINTEHPAYHSSFFYENRVVGRAAFGIDLDAINYEMGVTSGINTTVNRPFLLSIESHTPAAALPYQATLPSSVTPKYAGYSPFPLSTDSYKFQTPRAGNIFVFGLYDLTLRLSPINVIATGIVG